MLTGRDLSLIAIIGIILLIGIVKKNAIMMIDFALDAERTQGMPPQDAIYQAALLRFRPILMTTLAALFGALPLMFASGSVPSAAAARHRHGRRPARQPGAHAVHDARHLPVLRSARARAGPRASGSSCPRARREAGMSLSSPFIRRPVATTLLNSRSCWPARSRSRCCPCRRCRRWTSPSFRSAPTCRAPARRRWPRASHAARAGARHHCGRNEITS